MNKEECIKCKHNRNCFIRSTVGDNTCLKLKEQDQEIDRLNNIRVKALEFIYKKLIPENVDWDYDDCIFSDLPAAAIKPLVDILELKGEGNKNV